MLWTSSVIYLVTPLLWLVKTPADMNELRDLHSSTLILIASKIIMAMLVICRGFCTLVLHIIQYPETIVRAAFRIFFKGGQNGCSGVPGEANSICQSHTINLKGGQMPLPAPPKCSPDCGGHYFKWPIHSGLYLEH